MATPTVSPLRWHGRADRAPLVLAVMDGVGFGPGDDGDAVHRARTPHLTRLWAAAPTCTLRAHGSAVGLPSEDDMGNSEVGHNALGAGRVVRQGAGLVQDAIADGSIFASATWADLLKAPIATRDDTQPATLHLCGLLSDGNVHAHIDHVLALLDAAAAAGARRLRVHALADGRDVEDPSFEQFLERLDAHLERLRAAGCDARIASGGGRMTVTMDRYGADWSIVERGWRAHVLGAATPFPDWRAALAALRQLEGGQSDQTLPAFTIVDAAGPVGAVCDGDSFVFWNFRGDRAIEFTRAMEEYEFTPFDRGARPNVHYAGMMQYDGDLKLPTRYLVAPPSIEATMGAFLVATGLRTLAVSETQKFGHVTYFWNGNRSGTLDDRLERYVEVPSDRIAFDRAPAMKAAQITDIALEALASAEPPDLIRLNWANGDMVGHTGNLEATVTAVEAVDAEVGRLRAAVEAVGGVLVVTADHGNADDMWLRDKRGQPLRLPDGRLQPRTAHTLAKVPFSIVDARAGARRWLLAADRAEAGLGNVAATALELMGLEPPPHMDRSLLIWDAAQDAPNEG